MNEEKIAPRKGMPWLWITTRAMPQAVPKERTANDRQRSPDQFNSKVSDEGGTYAQHQNPRHFRWVSRHGSLRPVDWMQAPLARRVAATVKLRAPDNAAALMLHMD